MNFCQDNFYNSGGHNTVVVTSSLVIILLLSFTRFVFHSVVPSYNTLFIYRTEIIIIIIIISCIQSMCIHSCKKPWINLNFMENISVSVGKSEANLAYWWMYVLFVFLYFVCKLPLSIKIMSSLSIWPCCCTIIFMSFIFKITSLY